MAREFDLAPPFDVVGPKVVVRGLLFQDVVRSGHHRDREIAFLGPRPTLESQSTAPEGSIANAIALVAEVSITTSL